MTYSVFNIRNRLEKCADEKYRDFSSKLLPDTENLLGVRLPVLRKFAAEIAKTTGADYLKENNLIYFEELMLQGMIIGRLQEPPEIIIQHIKEFVPKIKNWSVCDSFCCGLKFVKGREEEFLEFVIPYLHSEKEFEVRFALVILLNYYISDKYIDTTLKLLNTVVHEGYYAKMAAAWAISICYINYPEKTSEFLRNTKVSLWIYNKALQKIIESTKITPQTKQVIRKLKKGGSAL